MMVSVVEGPLHTCCQDFAYLEFFAGRANLTYAMRQSGYPSCAFDILYGEGIQETKKLRRKRNNAMDLTTAAGFASLA